MTNNDYFEKKKIMIDSEDFLNEVERILKSEYPFTRETAIEDSNDLLAVSSFLSRLGKELIYSESKEYFRLVVELEKVIFNHSKNLIDEHIHITKEEYWKK